MTPAAADDALRPLAHDFWRFLDPLIDPLEGGFFDPRIERVRHRHNNEWLRRKLTAGDFDPGRVAGRWRRDLTAHLAGAERLHYVARPDSGRVMLCVDTDAHHGEPDAAALAAWVTDRYFPGSYVEPSRRGHHGHVLLDREPGRLGPEAFNDLADAAHRGLRALAPAAGFRAQVELKGRYTIYDPREAQVVKRGGLASVPRLPNGRADLERLARAPVFGVDVLERIVRDAEPHLNSEQRERGARALVTGPGNPSSPNTGCLPTSADGAAGGDAMERMRSCCRDLARALGRVPTLDELLADYARHHPDRPCDADRRRRARDAVKYAHKVFDPAKAGGGGGPAWSAAREALVRAVEAHCTPATFRVERVARRSGEVVADDWSGRLPAEALAVVLYTVTKGSFDRRADPRDQWTCGTESLRAMFKTLKAAGEYRGPSPGTNKLVAAKRVLEAAGLIACFDAGYNVGAWGGKAMSKKYHVGSAHPRHAEFLRASAGFPATRAADARATRAAAEGSVGTPVSGDPLAAAA
ncbi:MAG: hypothetical protein JWO31_3565 [Phycisphaerales bacterium]|nr:hypothetical protein [Phycisphaerales bacterium]